MADFYIRSAKALDRVLRDECSVKAAAAPHADAGRILAILVNSLAYRSALLVALRESKVMQVEERVFTLSSPSSADKGKGKGKPPSNDAPGKSKSGKKESPKGVKGKAEPSKEAFLLVLCHDLLFQSRGIQASKTWPPKVTLERYRPSLHSSLVKQQIRQGKARIQDLRSGALYQQMTARIPRWIRINTLRSTKHQVLSWLSENHFVQVQGPELEGIKEFVESQHVPGLLAFHPKATSTLLKSALYKESWIVMQDLASCFPAHILNPPPGAMVIDATSAPGNKTSHLSAIMSTPTNSPANGEGQKRGTIDAFERDPLRYKVLAKRLRDVGATGGTGNVVAQRKDFLTTKPEDFAQVTHMLVDPSCSGSGIVNRLDFLKEDDDVEDDLNLTSSGEGDETKQQKRLNQLSSFQLLMLRHAFTFPSLTKLVYSTCSIHAAENEGVVVRALETEEARERGWTLAPRTDVIPTWPLRGNKDACGANPHVAESVIRCVPGGTGEGDKPHVESCNGFFVACFVKNPDTSASKRKRHQVQHESDDDEEEQLAEALDEPATQSTSNAVANRKKKLQKRRKKQRLQEQATT